MIKIETIGCKNTSLEIQGDRHVLCLETMLLLVKEIESGIIKDEDKAVLKLVLDMDSELLNDVEQELKNTLAD